MAFEEGSPTSRDRSHEEPHNRLARAASKRRRLSPALASTARQRRPSAASPSPGGSFGSDVVDGCQTPSRDSESPTPHIASLADAAAAESTEHELGAGSSARNAPRGQRQRRDRDKRQGWMPEASSSKKLRTKGSKRGSGIVTQHVSHSSHDDASECTSIAAESTSRTSAQGTPTQHLTQNRGEGSRAAPLEYDVALIKFVASDAALRSYITGNGKGIMAGVVRFWEENGGTKPGALYHKLGRTRDRYVELKKRLTLAGQTTPSSAWSKKDLCALEDFERLHSNKILKLLHDELCSAEAGPMVASRSRRKAPLKDASGSADFAAESDRAEAETKLRRIKKQLHKQARRIDLLQAENEEQAQLVQQQAELLRQRAQQAEVEAAQSILQDERLERQVLLLESIQQDLESRYAAT